MSTDAGPSSSTPSSLGSAADAGSSAQVARADHVHALFEKRTLTVNYSDFTVDTSDGTQTLNLGAALPTAAIVVASQVTIGEAFAGDAAPAMDVGISGGHELAQAFDTTQAAGRYALAAPPAAQFDAAQLTLKFTPASGKKLKSDSSAGSLNVTVWLFEAY